MRFLLSSRMLKDETPALLVGSKGDINPVTLRVRRLGGYVELLVMTGEPQVAETPKVNPLSRGPVVAVPVIVKTLLRERVNAQGAQTVAEKIGCSRSAIRSLANGQTECHSALLEAIMGYLGNAGESMSLFENEMPR